VCVCVYFKYRSLPADNTANYRPKWWTDHFKIFFKLKITTSPVMPLVHTFFSVFLLARLQTWRAIIFSRVCLWVCLCVCLSVCLWPALLTFRNNRFWRNWVTRTLLWSSLAATIMVQIGCRGTVRRLFENFKKILKNDRIRKILVYHFLRLCLLCIVKKFRLDSTNKTDGGDTFWSLPLWLFRQWHCCSSTTLAGIL